MSLNPLIPYRDFLDLHQSFGPPSFSSSKGKEKATDSEEEIENVKEQEKVIKRYSYPASDDYVPDMEHENILFQSPSGDYIDSILWNGKFKIQRNI